MGIFFKDIESEEYGSEESFSLVGIPKELIEVIKMEACRGAVKFGDELRAEECQSIIKNLEKCKLPFQCAHGRPTVLPLTNIFYPKVISKNQL